MRTPESVPGLRFSKAPANPGVSRWVKERVHAPDLFERLRHIISRADGFVAVSGSVGTITEILLTWNLLLTRARPPAPLVLLGAPWKGWLDAHREPGLVLPELFSFVGLAETPEEAVRLVLDGVGPASA